MAAAQSQDGVSATNGPKHTRLFASRANQDLASGFDYASADEQMLTAEFGVAHPFPVVFEIANFDADLVGQFRIGGIDRAECGYQLFDLAFLQQVLVNHDSASLFRFLVGVEFPRQIPQVLAWVIEIDNRDGPGEMLFGNVPYPFRSISHEDLLFRAAPTTLPGFQIDAFAELHGGFNGADVGGRVGIADRMAILIPSGLCEHTAQLGLPRVGWLPFDLALPAHGLLLDHGHSGAIHLHIQDGNRRSYNHGQVQLHGLLNLGLGTGSDVLPDGFRRALHS